MEQISLFSLLSLSKKKISRFPNSFIYRDLCVFLVRQPYKRMIQLTVDANGQVRVNCARRISLTEISCFLESHWKWIQRRLLEQKKIKKKYPLKKFRQGELFLFRGKKLKLQYKNIFSTKSVSWQNENTSGFYPEADNLVYYWNHPADLSVDFLKKKLGDFYEKEGKSFLKKSLAVFSFQMQLFPTSVRAGSQKSKWGSCSSSGSISLNWRLAVAPPEVLDYVVIHELAHLKYLDHSVSFWSLVSRFCPRYKQYEDWLTKNTYAADFLLPYSELHR